MIHDKFLTSLVVALLLPLHASAAEKPWIEIRSPHFRVLSDAEERDARVAALRFEQMRSAFTAALPGLRLDPPVPLLIVAAKDERSLKTLFPEMWKRKGVKPSGFFASGSEKSFAVVRLDGSPQAVYHEYTHLVLNANFRWLPLWLNEGLAEFFGNTQFEADKIYLGASNIRAEYTRGLPLLPLEKLTHITLTSPEYRDPDKVQIFYSESWGLVHSLLGSGKRLQQFLDLLEKGFDQEQAFREAIGNFAEIQQQLRRYLDQTAFDSFAIDNPATLAEDAVRVRRLTSAESNAELGTAQLWVHENAAAQERLRQALKEDPKSALAAESMGFLKFAEGKDAEARGLFERALESDGKLYLSAYYKAMLSADVPSEMDLNEVIELNPQFAPAYIQLAATYVREGQFERAIASALKAQQLWPSKAGYHRLIGSLLRRVGREEEAAAVNRYVGERWPENSPLPGVNVIRGTISSLACREKDQTIRVTMNNTPLTLRADDAQMALELSDTVWYGPDHFNRCRHLAGLRAVIQYTPSGNIVRLEVGDDLLNF
jgi:tetratricopeptide (TPR) repeat protein